ncbi:LytTR family DNA-binding domain-containing protein [Bacteroidales bacterium OttesenSCG-928-C19]|nr:LytTR family DNA-binding domain-containing protein [Bacteroidales bacterium OttesenSCG-928-C19]
MKIKCVVVDDEPLALDLLEDYVKKTPVLELVARCNNAYDAIEVMSNEKVDLLFLDIQMPGLNGIEFSKTLRDSQKVIFTTAFQEYALDGFRVSALDYLLKPIDYTEFLQAVNKAIAYFNGAVKTQPQKKEEDNTLFIKSGHRWVHIDLDKVTYIENLKDYVKFHVEDEAEPISSLISMKSLEEKLPSKDFMRVHRSFIVNLKKIQTIERNCIIFGKLYIPVSDSYKKAFEEYIKTKFFDAK